MNIAQSRYNIYSPNEVNNGNELFQEKTQCGTVGWGMVSTVPVRGKKWQQ